jgi:predicted phage terminase large subunit-like protein
MPIYNEEKDEMLCDELMGKDAFMKLKKRMLVDSSTRVIFYANYMCEAIDDNETKVFPRSTIKRYKHIPTEIITENGKDKIVMQGWTFAAADTADEGVDYFSMPIMQVVGDNVYVFDAIFNQENLTLQESEIISKCKTNKIRRLYIETNNAGAYFKRRMEKKLPNIEVWGQWSKGNKMARIISQSGIIKNNFYFPENPNPTLHAFMNQMFRLLKTSKKEDDAGDAIAAASAHLEEQFHLFK